MKFLIVLLIYCFGLGLMTVQADEPQREPEILGATQEQFGKDNRSLGDIVNQLREQGYLVLRAHEISSNLPGLEEILVEYYVRILDPTENRVMDRVCPPENCPTVWRQE